MARLRSSTNFVFARVCPRIIFLLFFLLSSCSLAFPQNKRVLLVGISEYDINTGWKSIHGTNDIDLIKTVLKDASIRELRNSKATFGNITKELENLSKKAQKGDIVYVHLSGHGQPYEDMDGDEPDGWDESFVPYDAHFYYEESIYSGDKHLTDDILNRHFTNIRKKIGESGVLYVAIDACHAGNSYRDSEEDIYRGTGKGFSKSNKLYKVPKTHKQYYRLGNIKGCAPIVMMEACQSHQRNTEIKINEKYYGPLSYAIYKTLQSKAMDKEGIWINEIQSTMQELLPSWNRQEMVIESSFNH